MALKYLVVIVFFAVYAMWGRELGFSESSPGWTHLTYMFQHASVLHLILNSFVFISTFRVMERFIRPGKLFLIVFVIAFLASFAALEGRVTVGSSGMIYALLGMETVIVIFNNATAKQKRLFFFSIALMLTASFLSAGSAFVVHIVCFALGALYWMINNKRGS